MVGTLVFLESSSVLSSEPAHIHNSLGITKVPCSFDTNRGRCWRQRSFDSVPSHVGFYNNIYYSPVDDEKTQNTITFKGSFVLP